MRSIFGLLLTVLAATLPGANAWALCNASEAANGCSLPAHEAPSIPSTAEVLGGNDVFSVSPFTGAIQVQATDLVFP